MLGYSDPSRTCNSAPVLTTYLCCLSLPRADQAPKSRQSSAVPGAPSTCPVRPPPPHTVIHHPQLFSPLCTCSTLNCPEWNLSRSRTCSCPSSPCQPSALLMSGVLVPCSSALPRKSSKQPLAPWPCWVSCTHTRSWSRWWRFGFPSRSKRTASVFGPSL